MLRLDIPTAPFWVECAHGVRLLVRPCTYALNQAAVARVARRLREMDATEDADLRAGRAQAESLVALGEVLIEAWDGVGDAAGEAAAPVTADNIRALLSLPEIGIAFNQAISQPLARLAAEGNA